jgi:hypothetical protein
MRVTLNELEVSIHAWGYKTDSKNMAQNAMDGHGLGENARVRYHRKDYRINKQQ